MSVNMILPVLLLIQSNPDFGESIQGEEILVTGHRLDDWRGQVTETRRRRSCRTVKSTGNVQIDWIGCKALSACMVIAKPKAIAITKAHRWDKAARAKAMEPVTEEMNQCFSTRRDELVADYMERKRDGGGQ